MHYPEVDAIQACVATAHIGIKAAHVSAVAPGKLAVTVLAASSADLGEIRETIEALFATELFEGYIAGLHAEIVVKHMRD